MEKLSVMDAVKLVAQSQNKWAIYISWVWPDAYEDHEELIKAAPYLNLEDDSQIIFDGCAILLFETEEEMQDIFYRTVGDDGPTKLNNYNGKIRVYALTCNPRGLLLNENT